ncbi:PmoA family protein [Catenuloplanes indicus]|uniref:Methane monooxygenase PmoA-like n=1 Tax=Catenuloplanes indicus TaxID=137267 RepID=A0AAE3W4E8_9ACTN|nr:PmoA family protein [Catenuloplanes indicus]MDQ0369381.1 hypothetical protein [Catenuloplanes indicus]
MAESARLTVGGTVVARLQDGTDVDPTLGPRPYLHPVTTLTGVPVTDAFPEDHRWHLGASVAMQDVAGTNLWGGRTYVRGQGYTWLDDHGRIVTSRLSPTAAEDAFTSTLHWLDRDGTLLITEDRTISVRPVSDSAWALEVAYTLAAPPSRDIPLGSPATNGRPDAAGYGGFFWRCAPGPAEVFDASGARGETVVNGGTAPWVAFAAADHTLVFSGLGDGDHWFARTGIYPGVCVALAWEKPLLIPAGGTISRRHTAVVADGTLTPPEAAALGA